jgi:hypothetical protein
MFDTEIFHEILIDFMRQENVQLEHEVFAINQFAMLNLFGMFVFQTMFVMLNNEIMLILK